jgi:hypothetical protein
MMIIRDVADSFMRELVGQAQLAALICCSVIPEVMPSTRQLGDVLRKGSMCCFLVELKVPNRGSQVDGARSRSQVDEPDRELGARSNATCMSLSTSSPHKHL